MNKNKKLPVILLYQILKASEKVTHKLTPNLKTNNSIVSKNSNITAFAFIIQCFYNLLVSLYERKKARQFRQSKNRPEMIGYDHLPRSQWKNNYPIVLVHGFAGWAPDEGPIWGDYWKYMSDPIVSKHHRCYQADLGPVQSLHDRACELY